MTEHGSEFEGNAWKMTEHGSGPAVPLDKAQEGPIPGNVL